MYKSKQRREEQKEGQVDSNVEEEVNVRERL